MNQRERFHSAAVEQGIPDDEITTFTGFLRFAIGTSSRYDGVPVGQMGGLSPGSTTCRCRPAPRW
ncbi:hypothetical protein [Actinoplanes auranticolor]|uniref:Uncharacterized protein n=1 Tax=Actinoplanes auranticolor TaxID=47988 RepID=A0A919SPR7_9ACTN|nr:hypothetical protein [Actinoplanes auranticolor]GIM76070.1 hypothetical protein Aau02nite_69110 [Actinoplanes auranticolor]